ncbi:TPA: amidohydrolase family protein [Acinetobacter baumannii]
MEFMVFDADAHIMDSEGEIAKSANINRSRLMPCDAWDRSLGGKYPYISPSTTQHIDFMNRLKISQSVIYPTRSLSLGLQPEMQIAEAIVNGYHEVVKSFCEPAKNCLLPAALALPHNPSYTAAYIEKYKQEGFVALTLLPHGNGGLLGHKRFYELYEACEAASMPITIHPNSAGVSGLEEFSTFIEMHTCSVPFILFKQLVSLTFSGVFEKFPKLRWFFPEAGAGWLPFWIDRMDKEYFLRQSETSLTVKPSELLAQSLVYVSSGSSEEGLDIIDQKLGGGVVWASDYPHWDHEDFIEINFLVQNYGAEFTKRMLQDNAQSLYFGDIR